MKLTCSRSIESPNVRMDSAGYQANIFNYCEETGKTFAIGGRLDELTLKAIEAIPESQAGSIMPIALQLKLRTA